MRAASIVDDQPRIFRRLRLRLVLNSLRVAMNRGRIRLLTMLGTSTFVAAFTFGVGWYLFHQLSANNIPIKGLIVESLFDLLFFTLGGMLLFSTGIILYASLFTAPEAAYLLTTPARTDHVFATKFQSAIAFSSWAFVVLGLPIFLAYGLAAGVPGAFYVVVPLLLVGYVLLPGSLSAGLCLILVRYLPRNRRPFLAMAGFALVSSVLVWLWRVGRAAKKSMVTGGRELDELIGQFDLVRHELAPNHWMTRGVLAAARGDLGDALLPLALIWSHGLLMYTAAAWLAKRLYRGAYDRHAGGGGSQKIYGTSPLDHVMGWLVCYLAPATRVLVIKDFRTFRRDPTQWALLILFGLMMMLGAANFRNYTIADLAVMDRQLVSLFNLYGTAILLCAGLSRFIYPLISLEGRKFWILGLTPVSREQIVWGKFAFAATGSLLIAETLILGSDLLLGLPPHVMGLHAATVAVLALGLSALNVGLGASMPNFQETDPSKIVAGFGGTVNMVLGLLYLTVVLGTMAVPYHAAIIGQRIGATQSISPWVYGGVPVGVIVGILAVVVPLRWGVRSLRSLDF